MKHHALLLIMLVWALLVGCEKKVETNLKTLSGHTTHVWSVVFSPNGQLLASGSWDKTIKIWDVKSGACLKTLSGHTEHVNSVVFSPNGQLLASGSDDATIKLWDLASGACLKTLSGHTEHVNSVVFSPNGQLLASGSFDNTIKLWDLSSGACLKTLSDHSKDVYSVVFSPNGQLLASGSFDNTIKLWDLSSGACLKTLRHTSTVDSVVFSPNGQLLASGSCDTTIKVWDLASGACLKTLSSHTSTVNSVVFSPNGQLLASGSVDNTIKLWDLTSGACLKTLRGHTKHVWSIAFSPNGQLLASGGDDKIIKLWDLASEACLKALSSHTNHVWSVVFSPNGQLLASGCVDNTIKVWDLGSGVCLKTLSGHSNDVRSVVFSPNGQLLASGSADKTIKLWYLGSGACLKTLSDHSSDINSVVFSPNGQLLASGSEDHTIKLWDLASGTCLKTLSGHTEAVRSVVFSPNGQLLASGSGDTTIKVWDLASGACLKTLSSHTEYLNSVVFSPNGQFLASGGGDRTIKLWDLASGACLKTLSSHTNHVWSVVFSPNGQLLASGSVDKTIKVWDFASGACLKTLSGHSNDVRSVVFSLNGQLLASGNNDNFPKLWKWQKILDKDIAEESLPDRLENQRSFLYLQYAVLEPDDRMKWLQQDREDRFREYNHFSSLLYGNSLSTMSALKDKLKKDSEYLTKLYERLDEAEVMEHLKADKIWLQSIMQKRAELQAHAVKVQGEQEKSKQIATNVAAEQEFKNKRIKEQLSQIWQIENDQSVLAEVVLTPVQLFYKADAAYGSGQYVEAEDFCRQALRQRSEYLEVFLLLGRIHIASKRYRSALDWLMKAKNVDPNNSLNYLLLGQSYEALELYQEAWKHYQAAIVCNPELATAFAAREALRKKLSAPDTDGDGLKDFEEITVFRTDYQNQDTDGDGLNDYLEIRKIGSDPLKPDLELAKVLAKMKLSSALSFEHSFPQRSLKRYIADGDKELYDPYHPRATNDFQDNGLELSKGWILIDHNFYDTPESQSKTKRPDPGLYYELYYNVFSGFMRLYFVDTHKTGSYTNDEGFALLNFKEMSGLVASSADPASIHAYILPALAKQNADISLSVKMVQGMWHKIEFPAAYLYSGTDYISLTLVGVERGSMTMQGSNIGLIQGNSFTVTNTTASTQGTNYVPATDGYSFGPSFSLYPPDISFGIAYSYTPSHTTTTNSITNTSSKSSSDYQLALNSKIQLNGTGVTLKNEGTAYILSSSESKKYLGLATFEPSADSLNQETYEYAIRLGKLTLNPEYQKKSLYEPQVSVYANVLYRSGGDTEIEHLGKLELLEGSCWNEYGAIVGLKNKPHALWRKSQNIVVQYTVRIGFCFNNSSPSLIESVYNIRIR